MREKVRKFHFKFGWNIGKYENWFYDMSAKGLHLKKLGRIFATFEKGDESKRVYRIYISDGKPLPSVLELFKNKGWEFITSRGDFQIFSSPIYYNATEIYDNPAEYSNRLIDKAKSLKNNLIFSIIITMMFIVFVFYMVLSSSTTILGLIRWQVVLQLLAGTLAFIEFFKQIKSYRTIIKLRKSLIKSNSINHREPWKKTRFINGTFSVLSITIKLIIIIIPLTQIFMSFNDEMAATKRNFPIVSLSEIEQRSDFEDMIYSDVIDHRWSVLAPAQLTIYEKDFFNSEKVGENNLNNTLEKKYSTYVQTEYYKLTFTKMANALIQEMIHSADGTPKRIKDTNFEQLYINDKGVRKDVFACWENNVIHIEYYGKKDINQIVSILSEKTYRY